MVSFNVGMGQQERLAYVGRYHFAVDVFFGHDTYVKFWDYAATTVVNHGNSQAHCEYSDMF